MYGLQLSGLGAVNLTTGYDGLISNASIKYGVDTNLIKAFIQTESSWNPNAVRQEPQINDASIGLMQVLLKTAQWITNNYNLTSANLYNVGTNIDIGTKYIAKQLSRYGGNVSKAVAAYNAGSARYKLNGDFINQGYVDKVMGYYQEYVDNNQVAYSDYELPVPYITMDINTADTSQADIATADVPDIPSEVYSSESITAALDNPDDISLPFNPIVTGIVLGGVLVITGGGFAIFKSRK